MTTVERRLEQLTQELSARERAILVLQSWLRDEEWDKNLVWKMPQEQKAEYDRICEAIERANHEFMSNAIVEQLWIFEDEIRLGWLEHAWAVQERVARLEAELRSRKVKVRRSARRTRSKPDEVVLEPLPDPVHGLAWTMEPLYGERKDDGEPDPTGEEVIPALLKAVRQGVERRWKDLASVRVVLKEMSSALDGYNATLLKVDEALTMLEGRVREIHAALQRFERFPLPEVDEAAVAVTRGWVRFDDIRGAAPVATTGGQQWESDYAKKQREEANVAARAQLEAERARRDGEDASVFTPGG